MGDTLALGPAADTDETREMLPEKPLTLAMLIIDVPAEPEGKLREAELEVRVKPTTCTVTVSVWESGPLVSKTVTV